MASLVFDYREFTMSHALNAGKQFLANQPVGSQLTIRRTAAKYDVIVVLMVMEDWSISESIRVEENKSRTS
jgi:cytochrome c oxidase assembly factor CtaG